MRMLNRMLALLLALLFLIPAASAEGLRGYDKKAGYVYVAFGSFPQTAEGDVEPIVWRVLSTQDDQAYLLSEYVLEARRIHGDYNEYANKPTAKKNPGFDGDFTRTEMSQYLNGDFTGNFTAGELALLQADETLGLFWLLSGDELKNGSYGFSSDSDRKAWGTEYAKANGLFVYSSSRGSHSPYWTRTQSTTNRQGARCIKSKGELGYINVITEDEGMRPACLLDLAKVEITGGSGTLEDPYVLLTEETPAAAPAQASAEAAPCCTPGECACCASCACGCQN